jgi:hypothetical protein
VLLLLVGIIAVGSHRNHSSLFKIRQPEKFVSTFELTKKWYSKVTRWVQIIVEIGFGVIGCWWFFIIGVLRISFVYIMNNLISEEAEKYLKEHPEMIPKKEEKIDKKLKFNFLKKS